MISKILLLLIGKIHNINIYIKKYIIKNITKYKVLHTMYYVVYFNIYIKLYTFFSILYNIFLYFSLINFNKIWGKTKYGTENFIIIYS